jgi:UDP-glucose 4-epimerase
MKILVVGGAGYIGSVCAELLLNKGHVVSIFDNLSEGHRAAIDSRAEFTEGDLQDRQSIEKTLAKLKPDAVMHFAANALVGESMQNPSKYFRNNIANGLNLLDAMVSTDVRKIVFSSTCAIFGPPERLPIDETIPKQPINPYGESKLAFEKILRWYDQIHGLKFVSLRYFNAAGASQKFGEDHRLETHLIPNVLKVALGEKSNVEIFGIDYETPDGTCIRDYIHVNDLAEAHVRALRCLENGEDSLALNLGTGEGHSVLEIVQAAEAVTGRAVRRRIVPRRPGDPPVLVADATQAERVLQWKAARSLRDIVSTAWAWMQRQ